MNIRSVSVVAISFSLVLGIYLRSPRTTPAQDAKTKTKSEAKAKDRLDLNAATEKELEELPGVGTATAKKIIAGRPYKSIEGLSKAGVPEATIEKIKAHVIVHRETAAKSNAATEKKADAEKPDSAPMVDINRAPLSELETLPGVGPTIGKEIIAARPFKTVDELEHVKGMGKAKFAAIKDRVTVGAPAKPAAQPKPTVGASRPAAPLPKPSVAAAAKDESPRETAKPAQSKAKVVAAGKININTASLADLQTLPGIGPVKSQAIIDARPFKTIEDIMKVKGIKEGEFGKIKELIRVE